MTDLKDKEIRDEYQNLVTKGTGNILEDGDGNQIVDLDAKEDNLSTLSTKGTIVDADSVGGVDSEDADTSTRWLWSTVKTFLANTFAALAGSTSQDWNAKNISGNGLVKNTMGSVVDHISIKLDDPDINQIILLLGRVDSNFEIAGQIIGITSGDTSSKDRILVNIVGSESSAGTARTQFNASIMKVNNRATSIRFITCDYDDGGGSDSWIGIEMTGVGANWYPRDFLFRGYYTAGSGFFPEVIAHSAVSNIADLSKDETSATRYLTDLSIFQGDVTATGTVTADDYITTSRVESDRENALSVLDNIEEWKKPDGSIDYKKHYAYKPRIEKDATGEDRELPGLSMETRVAMLEKMVSELKVKTD